jgi:predicted solute-binding protein
MIPVVHSLIGLKGQTTELPRALALDFRGNALGSIRANIAAAGSVLSILICDDLPGSATKASKKSAITQQTRMADNKLWL